MALQLYRTVVDVAHNSPSEGDALHCIWKSTGQLASENVLSRQQGKKSISLEIKLQWRFNCIRLLLMLRTTAPVNRVVYTAFGRARRMKLVDYQLQLAIVGIFLVSLN